MESTTSQISRNLNVSMFLLLLVFCCASAVSPAGGGTTANEVKEPERQARDYSYSYYPDDEKKNQYYEYPSTNYVSFKEEMTTNPVCPPNSLAPLLGNGLNFLLLKLGAVGIIKSIIAVIFFLVIIKLPILLAKFAFIKAVIFPALMAPMMMLMSNMGNNMMSMMMMDKPKATTEAPAHAARGASSKSYSRERALNDALTQSAYQSFKFFMDSELCAERMACQLGVLNNDTASGASLGRMAKYIEQSSPNGTRGRIRSLREAFSNGNIGGECPQHVYPCQSPQLILSQGANSFRVL